MATPITAYRVFIASPGGLEDERKAFRRALETYNEADAIDRGVIFLPIGWEITRGGVGRPQKLINDEVRKCDYFVLVLGDRWGSPPQANAEGPFQSGSEEELSVARTCHKAGTMRDIIIMFRDVAPERLADPGAQLHEVLSFREQLEKEKLFYFETFDEIEAFAEKLRRHLPRWVRDHEQGEAVAAPPVAPPVAPEVAIESPPGAPEDSQSELVQDAEELARQGRFAEAERAFAQVVPQADLDSLNRYGAVLVEKGSLERAERAFKHLHDTADDRGQPDWVVASLNNLARVYVARKKYDLAESAYLEVLELRKNAFGANSPEVAASLNELAALYASLDRFDEAEPLLRQALDIQGVTLAE